MEEGSVTQCILRIKRNFTRIVFTLMIVFLFINFLYYPFFLLFKTFNLIKSLNNITFILYLDSLLSLSRVLYTFIYRLSHSLPPIFSFVLYYLSISIDTFHSIYHFGLITQDPVTREIEKRV